MIAAKRMPDFPSEITKDADGLEIAYQSIAEWPNKKQKKLIKDMFREYNESQRSSGENNLRIIEPELLFFAYYKDYDEDTIVRIIDSGCCLIRGKIDWMQMDASAMTEGSSFVELIDNIARVLNMRGRTQEEIDAFEELAESRNLTDLNKPIYFGIMDDEGVSSLSEIDINSADLDNEDVDGDILQNILKFPNKDDYDQ